VDTANRSLMTHFAHLLRDHTWIIRQKRSCLTRTAGKTSSSFELIICTNGNPGSAAIQSGNVSNLLRFVADQYLNEEDYGG
jgi:hypothetical protein